VLQILTTEEFAAWFEGLGDEHAEDVATAIDVVEQLGPTRAPPGSRESLLWYEHPDVSRFGGSASLAWELEDWGAFRDYAHQILAKLESPRFAARLARLDSGDARRVLASIREIKRASDPRFRWRLTLNGDPRTLAAGMRPEDACEALRRTYFAALETAGYRAPPFPLLYGVHPERETALFVLGEWLDRSFYGDSVRRAEKAWKQFLDGTLRAEPAQLR
jgi:hypothetical protein